MELDVGFISGKKKAHKHKVFGPVALGTTPDLSQGQTQFVPGTNPGFLLVFHSGSPVCPSERGRREAEKVYVLKFYVPFSLAATSDTKGAQQDTPDIFGKCQNLGDRTSTPLPRLYSFNRGRLDNGSAKEKGRASLTKH